MMNLTRVTAITFVVLSLYLACGGFSNSNDSSENSQNRLRCKESVTFNGSEKFVWKAKNLPVVTSTEDNICWNASSGNLGIRECTVDRRWIPENVTCSILQMKNNYCPEDLTEIKFSLSGELNYLCIKISAVPQQFDEKFCYGSDTLPPSNYGDNLLTRNEVEHLSIFLRSKNISGYWLPAQKWQKRGPFAVVLPGSLWKDMYDIPLSFEENISSEKNCLAVAINGTSLYSEAVGCNKSLHSVCVFRKDFVTVSGCPQGFGSMSYRPKDCYGIKWKVGLFSHVMRPVSVSEYFDERNKIKKILQEKDARNKARRFIVGSVNSTDGKKYAIEMDFKENIIIIPWDEMRPALSNECVVNRKSVQMSLKMDAELETLLLTVYNRNYIWRLGYSDNFGIKCYTNADYELWRKVKVELLWENELETKSLFKVKVVSENSGYYWCEAHTIFDFELVKTAPIVVSDRQKGHSFALLFDIQCDNDPQECSNSNKNIKKLSKKVKRTLNSCKESGSFENLNIFNVRIMKILSFKTEEKHNTLRCLCHVTVSLKSSSVDNSFELQNSEEESDSKEDDLGIRHDTSVRMEQYQLLQELMQIAQPQLASSVKSTEFCFPESFQTQNGMRNQWNLASLGQTATALILCLQPNGLPLTRNCYGDFLNGAYWEDINKLKLSCLSNIEQNTVTKYLFELDFARTPNKEPKAVMKDIKHLLKENMSNLIPADFYYMAKIVKNAIETLFSPNSTILDENTVDIVQIYNYLMDVSENVIKPSTVLNSTNILLEAFENVIDRISTMKYLGINNKVPETKNESGKSIVDNNALINTIEYEDVGVTVKIASNFVIFSINPAVANITGIAFFRKDEDEDEDSEDDVLGALQGAFSKEVYRFILADQKVDELLDKNNIELATYVPYTLYERLNEISSIANGTVRQQNEAKVVIKVYSNDKFFQEDTNAAERSVAGRIISVSIPGYTRDLPEMIPLIFRAKPKEIDNNDTRANDNYCSYWNYKTWSNDGLVLLGRSEINNNIVLCGCMHLTPFAFLVGGSHELSHASDPDVGIETHIHKEALDAITLLGCILSLLGIIGIFITAATFQSWRQKASSKVLLQLSASIALQMVLFCFINTEKNTQHLIENNILSSCIAIGCFLHYAVLIQFCWMLIIAYLQFKRYVQVFGKTRPKHFFIKSTTLGWGLPLIPVLLVLIFDRESYIPKGSSTSSALCYPSGYSLYFGVVLPISVAVLANFIIFIVVLYSILRSPAGSIRHTEKKLALSQIRLSLFLFFLLGLTWIFGLMTTMKAGLVFSYLFSFTATLQGFVLFIYFIILDPKTRRMWSVHCQRIFGIKPNYDDSTSMKETTQTM